MLVQEARPIAVGEPGDIADVDEDPGGDDGPTPGSSIRVEPRASSMALSSLVEAWTFLSNATRSVRCSTAIRRRVFPTASRGRTEARNTFACREVMSFFPTPGIGSDQSLEPVDGLDALPGELFAALNHQSHRLQLTVLGEHSQVLGADRDDRDRVRVVGVGLAVVAGIEQPRPDRELGRHINPCSPSASSRCANGRPVPLLPSTAQIRPGQEATCLRIAA